MNAKNQSKDPQVGLQEAIDKGIGEITEISKTTIENLQNAAQDIVQSAREKIEQTAKENKSSSGSNHPNVDGNTFLKWLTHTLHYPGDEKAQVILDEFEAAAKAEAKRIEKVKEKLGRR